MAFTVNPDQPAWTLWRLDKGFPMQAGTFHRWRDGNNAIAQLRKLSPNSQFRLQYTGASIRHCGDAGKALT